jgi:hypothetical protein
MTHEELRKTAVKWLTNTRRCSVVLSEIVTGANETPDAIGWHRGGAFSILVECKISRSDFFRNDQKWCSRAGKLTGSQRYFMVPEDLVSESDMGKFPEYGLLSVGAHRICVLVEAPYREPDMRNEVIMLVSALRRVRTREFLTINVIEDCDAEPRP